jgi:hypothetical protein
LLYILHRRAPPGPALAREAVEQVAIEAKRPPCVRLRFVDDLPGHGLRVYRVAPGRADRASPDPPALRSHRRTTGAVEIENAFWRVEAGPDGRVTLERRADGLRVDDALRLVSEGDRGDEYNFDPVRGAPVVERPARARVFLERGEASLAIVLDGRWRVPASLRPDRKARSERMVELRARLRARLAPDLDRVDVEIELDNTARDHRLRIHVRAPFTARRFEVESAFELAERPIAPQPADFGAPNPAEFPIGAVPQRAFATITDGTRALSVANRGNAEVEAVPEPDGTTSLAVTILRAVGWLSRGDLSSRPPPAGPPFETPGAQAPGPHRAELSLRWHADGDPARLRAAHGFAYPPLAFLAPGGGIASLADRAQLVEVDDPQVAVSAIEPQPGGGALLRLWNTSGEPRHVTVRWAGGRAATPAGVTLERVDLEGRRVAPAPGDRPLPETGGGPGVTLALRPHEIASLRAG